MEVAFWFVDQQRGSRVDREYRRGDDHGASLAVGHLRKREGFGVWMAGDDFGVVRVVQGDGERTEFEQGVQ